MASLAHALQREMAMNERESPRSPEVATPFDALVLDDSAGLWLGARITPAAALPSRGDKAEQSEPGSDS